MADRILFIGYCWGAAGSTWLARLLNGHPDIFCVHNPQFPRFDYFKFEDLAEVIEHVFRHQAWAGAYPVVGFTHGVALEWHGRIRQKYGDQLRCFVLTRHPIMRIQSSYALHVSRKAERSTDSRWIEAYVQTYQELVRLARKKLPDDFESLAFYKSCAMVNSILAEHEQGLPLYRLEDLLSEEEAVQSLLAHISSGTCRLPSDVIETMQRTVVRGRAAQIRSAEETYASWRPEHREAYHYLVTGKALEVYRQVGYEFPHQT